MQAARAKDGSIILEVSQGCEWVSAIPRSPHSYNQGDWKSVCIRDTTTAQHNKSALGGLSSARRPPPPHLSSRRNKVTPQTIQKLLTLFLPPEFNTNGQWWVHHYAIGLRAAQLLWICASRRYFTSSVQQTRTLFYFVLIVLKRILLLEKLRNIR